MRSIHLTNKQYTLTDKGIQLLVTEFYGTITSQTATKTLVKFDDLVINHVGADSPTEIIAGEILLASFEQAIQCFKKPTKSSQKKSDTDKK